MQIAVTGMDALVRRLRDINIDAPKAGSRAVNKTIAEVRTAVGRLITSETGITRGALLGTKKGPKDYVTTGEPATPANQSAALYVTRERLPLSAFNALQTSKGVRYRLPKGRGFIAGAFLATMRSGHTGVFVRAKPGERQTAGRRGTTFNLPIIEQRGPSPGHIVEKNMAAIRLMADAALQKNLNHEIDWIIRQRGGAVDAVA